MRKTILETVCGLRGGRPLSVDRRNSNRYRIVSFEEDGSRTAYYFSTPIYNEKTGKLLDAAFHEKGNGFYSVGSNSTITGAEDVLMENPCGYCRASLNGRTSFVSESCVRTKAETISPTTNGVIYTVRCSEILPYHLTLTSGQSFLPVRENGKYFALMSEEFKPFVSVSCIGALDRTGRVIAPAELTYRKINDRMYDLFVRPRTPSEQYVMFEVNLYEPKLFQDTTVESGNPGLNNAFGAAAYIGNTRAYGEQWLYTRPDLSKMPELFDCQIRKAVFHLPKLSAGNVPLSAYGVSARFCSFGSTWENKISQSAREASSREDGGYIDFDITHLLREESTGFLKRSEGLILRTSVKDSGFCAIATGDSYFTPQILEVNFR